MVEVAKGLGLAAGDSIDRLSDAFVGEVVSVMRPPRPDRHGDSWALLVKRYVAAVDGLRENRRRRWVGRRAGCCG